MIYDESFLGSFDGSTDPNEVNMAELANSIEKFVSQMKYTYNTSIDNCPTIEIKVLNNNIPHLLGLSRDHHYGLSTYHAAKLFTGLKNDLTLETLKESDQGWFDESKDKIIGVLLLYQMLNMINSQAYTTGKLQRVQSRRFQRDSIYFLLVRANSHYTYSLELSPDKTSVSTFVPKSLKLNDDKAISSCTKISLNLKAKERIK